MTKINASPHSAGGARKITSHGAGYDTETAMDNIRHACVWAAPDARCAGSARWTHSRGFGIR
jgi:hypothetical protein